MFRELDTRRWVARARAAVWFIGGCLLSAAVAGFLVFVPVAVVTHWLDAGPNPGFVALVAMAVALGLLLLFALRGLMGSPRSLLAQVGAHAVTAGDPAASPFPGVAPNPELQRQVTRFRNVVEGLVVGLGVPAPDLALVDDPAPNALSLRRGRHRTLIVTTGLLAFPRDEIEAVCAHELAHLHAADALWISALGASMGRARRLSLGLLSLGGLLVGLGVEVALNASFKVGGVVLLVGVALFALGSVVAGRLRAVLDRIRREGDAIADVAAVVLARNPVALGDACERLAADPRRVRRSQESDRRLWFELVPDAEAVAMAAALSNVKSAATINLGPSAPEERREAVELLTRSAAAYAEAGVRRG